MHFDGKINNSFGFAFAPRVVNPSHEIAERQRSFAGMDFYVLGPHFFGVHFHLQSIKPVQALLFQVINNYALDISARNCR
jgi:hypothetical protein